MQRVKNSSAIEISIVCEQLRLILIEKNKRYGNSALKPINVFNKGKAKNSLYVRIDDKISRINNSEKLRKNDVCDMLGYSILIGIVNKWITKYWLRFSTTTKIEVACYELSRIMSRDHTLPRKLDRCFDSIKNSEKLKKYHLYELLKALVYICIANKWFDWSEQID